MELRKIPGYSNLMTAEEIIRILEHNDGPAPLALSIFRDWAIVKALASEKSERRLTSTQMKQD